mmetsp:Transcript_9700/g.15194  ORF Transcript_9700/g.15194 Transcript_9700/m.15194 type:complete len:102 (+) Transcript_9700:747-1052(+)
MITLRYGLGEQRCFQAQMDPLGEGPKWNEYFTSTSIQNPDPQPGHHSPNSIHLGLGLFADSSLGMNSSSFNTRKARRFTSDDVETPRRLLCASEPFKYGQI